MSSFLSDRASPWLLAFVLIACGGSPRGLRVVFDSALKLDGTDARNPNLTTNIWLVNADGTGLIPLTKATAYQAHSYSASFSR